MKKLLILGTAAFITVSSAFAESLPADSDFDILQTPDNSFQIQTSDGKKVVIRESKPNTAHKPVTSVSNTKTPVPLPKNAVASTKNGKKEPIHPESISSTGSPKTSQFMEDFMNKVIAMHKTQNRIDASLEEQKKSAELNKSPTSFLLQQTKQKIDSALKSTENTIKNLQHFESKSVAMNSPSKSTEALQHLQGKHVVLSDAQKNTLPLPAPLKPVHVKHAVKTNISVAPQKLSQHHAVKSIKPLKHPPHHVLVMKSHEKPAKLIQLATAPATKCHSNHKVKSQPKHAIALQSKPKHLKTIAAQKHVHTHMQTHHVNLTKPVIKSLASVKPKHDLNIKNNHIKNSVIAKHHQKIPHAHKIEHTHISHINHPIKNHIAFKTHAKHDKNPTKTLHKNTISLKNPPKQIKPLSHFQKATVSLKDARKVPYVLLV